MTRLELSKLLKRIKFVDITIITNEKDSFEIKVDDKYIVMRVEDEVTKEKTPPVEIAYIQSDDEPFDRPYSDDRVEYF